MQPALTNRLSVICAVLLISIANATAQDRSWIGVDEGEPPLTREMTARIEFVLKERTTCDFNNSPLEDVMREIEMKHQIPIWLDQQGLQDEGISLDQPVKFEKANITLQTALRYILEPIGLTWIVQDGMLMVTTQAKADERMSTRIYPVADLIASSTGKEDYDSLIQIIQNTNSARWLDLDQEGGAIEPFRNSRTLVIRQTRSSHDQVVGVLAALRKAKQLQGGDTNPFGAEDSIRFRPASEIARPKPRTLRSTQSWQIPRIHAND